MAFYACKIILFLALIYFPDFDTLSVFIFQIVDKQRSVEFAPPFWVAQA